MYHNNIVDALKIHICPLPIGLGLPGAVSPDVFHFAFLPLPQITLTVPEVVGTENGVPLVYHFRSTQVALPRCSHSHLSCVYIKALLR